MFVDCLRGLMRETVKEEKIPCILPWIQSMQGISEYGSTTDNLSTCNSYEDYISVTNLGYYFAQNASSYSHSKCPGSC